MTDEALVLRRLEEVFEDVFGEAIALTRETTADDVEAWDSVKTVELVVAIEREFDVRFSVGEIARLATVGQLIERIADRAT
jgi:acyl carrier protein